MGVGVGVGLSVGVGVGMSVGVGVGLSVGVGVGLSVGVGVGLSVGVGVGEAGSVGDGVAVAVPVSVGVAEGLAVVVGLAETVAVPVGDGVTFGSRRGLTVGEPTGDMTNTALPWWTVRDACAATVRSATSTSPTAAIERADLDTTPLSPEGRHKQARDPHLPNARIYQNTASAPVQHRPFDPVRHRRAWTVANGRQDVNGTFGAS